MKKLLLLPLLLIGSSAWAETIAQCEALNFAETDNFTWSECSFVLEQEYSKQLKQLISEIKKEAGSKELRNILDESQDSFNTYKNDQCSYFIEANKGAASAAGPISMKYCEAKLTKQRLDYLKTSFR